MKSLSISPYSVRMQENTDQTNSEYGHFLRSVCFQKTPLQIFQAIPEGIFVTCDILNLTPFLTWVVFHVGTGHLKH